MPFYDRICRACGAEYVDCYESVNALAMPCDRCGEPTERAWLTKTPSVIPDEIPGGMEIRNGICNDDGTPRTYYSRSEMRREAERRGIVNHVEHLGARGSDRSPHTVRWV